MKHGTIARIAGGYLEAGRGLLGLLLVLAASAAASLVITLPLWLFAVNAPVYYSAFILAGAVLAAAAAAVRFLASGVARGGLSVPRFLRLRFLPALLRAVLCVAAAVSALALLAARLYLPLAAFLLLFLAAFGWWRYGRKRT